jgi:hypothetical protein
LVIKWGLCLDGLCPPVVACVSSVLHWGQGQDSPLSDTRSCLLISCRVIRWFVMCFMVACFVFASIFMGFLWFGRILNWVGTLFLCFERGSTVNLVWIKWTICGWNAVYVMMYMWFYLYFDSSCTSYQSELHLYCYIYSHGHHWYHCQESWMYY